jgi:hypothetical protein
MMKCIGKIVKNHDSKAQIIFENFLSSNKTCFLKLAFSQVKSKVGTRIL